MIMKSQTTTLKLYLHEAKAENDFTLKTKFFFWNIKIFVHKKVNYYQVE